MTDVSEDRPVLSGRYELHRRIARGGMAEVFLARDQLLDRPVAVKVLFPQYAADPTFVARFRREAQAAANLNHPSVVAVYDWGHQDDTYFIVMEYVEGQSLAELLADEGPLEVNRATDIVADVAAALGFAHRNGTVHRDVKPGNIMITSDDQVKVADFGIARAFGGAEDQLTQTGSVMGTASYFSPEQAQGKHVDPRSDLYSLGVVFFEMITGQTPFSGESPVAIAYKHVQETPPRPSEINPTITPDLEGVVARMLAKNPDQRYASAEDLRTDLRRYRAGQPLASGFESNGDGATQALQLDSTRVEPASRAVIDTTRAVPASVASGRAEPVEEYYEEPNRTGIFLVMLLGLLVVLVGLLVLIIRSLSGGEAEVVKVEVPEVIGLTVEVATAELEADGFEVNPVLGESEREIDEVFDQDPKGGEEADEGSIITISVTEGEETVEVPDVVGKPVDEATAELEALGFEVNVESEKSEDIAEDNVISVSPDVGEKANDGGTITLTVSEGGELVTVPSVQGMSAGDANNLLQGEGLRTDFVEEASPVPKGQAIRTDPASGRSVPPGSQVQLFISSGSDSTEFTVPDVSGKTEAEARAELIAAGFTASNIVVNTDESPVEQNGEVIEQSVASNTEASSEDAITITIGSGPGSTTTTAPETTTTTAAEP